MPRRLSRAASKGAGPRIYLLRNAHESDRTVYPTYRRCTLYPGEVPVSGDLYMDYWCQCTFSDPWRCAVNRGLSTVICHCQCHRNRVGDFNVNRISRDQMCMEFAISAARRSTCLRRQIGAVIAVGGRPLAIGYNGAPPAMPHCTPETCNETTPCKNTIHAELNAIAWAARMGVATSQSFLYTTVSPCWECAKAIVAAGIKRVIYQEDYRLTEPIQLLLRAEVMVARLKDGVLFRA